MNMQDYTLVVERLDEIIKKYGYDFYGCASQYHPLETAAFLLPLKRPLEVIFFLENFIDSVEDRYYYKTCRNLNDLGWRLCCIYDRYAYFGDPEVWEEKGRDIWRLYLQSASIMGNRPYSIINNLLDIIEDLGMSGAKVDGYDKWQIPA